MNPDTLILRKHLHPSKDFEEPNELIHTNEGALYKKNCLEMNKTLLKSSLIRMKKSKIHFT